jgi:Cdc6-like AAA superfamily ATPase
MQLSFKEFTPKEANMDSILILGKRGVGKTVLVNDLLPHLNCENLLVFKPTESVKPEYNHWNLPSDINKEYCETILESFINKQKAFVREHDILPPHACVVFEDCMYDNRCWQHKPMNELYSIGRYLRTKSVMVMQYPLILPPMFRTNIDYVFIFKNSITSVRQRIYDQYCCMFPSFAIFNQVFDDITKEPFTCMVINNTAKSNKLEDQVFWYKANRCYT